MKVGKIDVSKIDKASLFKGSKGTYLDIVLIDKPDQFGNDGFISQGISKERRDKGEKGIIIGNWKRVGTSKPSQKQTPPAMAADDEGPDSLPF